MSVLFSHTNGWILCHKSFIKEVYKDVKFHDEHFSFHLDDYFEINNVFMKSNQISVKERNRKRKSRSGHTFSEEVEIIQKSYETIKYGMASFGNNCSSDLSTGEKPLNESARVKANGYFNTIADLKNLSGGNTSTNAIIVDINESKYLLPPKCSFFSCNVLDFPQSVKGSMYDLILLDPPWYNRFVKRRKKYNPEHGYEFLDDSSLKEIPVGSVLRGNGLVAVWATNSLSHLQALKGEIFPSWGVKYTATWFWIKVTNQGQLITKFTSEGGKQPYERLVLGVKDGFCGRLPEDNKCFISVPSAIHSHKPPLTGILKDYLPQDPECLELFARYLLPGWTSLGNQVLSMQLMTLYNKISFKES